MKALNDIPRNLRVVGITMTLAALAIALVAVVMTAATTMAQSKTAPQPCGPDDVPDNPDATITQGHYAVFDGYWDSTKKTLNLNLCPPAVVHHMETRRINRKQVQVEVSTRTASNVDIQKTVIHIDHIDGIDEDEQFKHTLTAADVDKYDFFKTGVSTTTSEGTHDTAVGTSVWWLKVDDESTPNVDEDSPLAMGFSAALFDSNDWYLADGTTKGAKPLQYEFEVIREPGIPVDEQGHVFAFDDSAEESKTAYWDSSEVDANALPLYPGDYQHLQWAFTKPGTYEISVQLKGHVRQKALAGAPAGWKPISSKKVETSEVGRYDEIGVPASLGQVYICPSTLHTYSC